MRETSRRRARICGGIDFAEERRLREARKAKAAKKPAKKRRKKA